MRGLVVLLYPMEYAKVVFCHPFLFSIYMDALPLILSESRIDCHIDDLCINHVFYADDLCLMAPCAIALQELITLCYEHSIDIDLNFNVTKSYCVTFTSKLYKLALPSLHIKMGLSHRIGIRIFIQHNICYSNQY